MNSYTIEAGTAQHIGNRPQQNDRTAVFSSASAPGYMLAVLADAVAGGSAASEQMLHTAKLVFDTFRPGDHPTVDQLADVLREIVHETHLVIKMNAVASETEQLCTFVGLILSPHGEAVWAHVGDSRLYRFEKSTCMARTNDASYVEYLVATEKLPLEAARNHRHSKLLLNLLGNSRKEPYVTIGSADKVGPNESFLLCSDGLWCFFTDAELGAAVHKHAQRQASEMLIGKAQERAQGKGDNCSMAIIKLVKPPKEAPPTYTVQKMRRAV
ncbi:PP2C family protein-serine/threonine phosphatase [Pseudoduganella sp. GCM10020061]|uniref:PP2C family protein-serine/threonine phosphatase n=1 Tax=Pseudoduganella sp. GCM10020061 TaxID=3317345 RepID=UPI00364373CC